jgi:hypothetical protein
MPDDFAGRPRSPGEGRVPDRDVLAGGPGGLDRWRPGGVARWLGRMSTRTAVLVLFAGTLLGVIFTLAAGQEPGGLLGFFIIVGTIAAALGIQRGKVYLLFPAPALAFFVAAIVTGKVHDAKLGSSTAGLGAGFTQWIAGIFFPAALATIVVLLVGGGRWLLGRQLVTGQSPLSAGRPAPGNGRPAPRDRRAAVDPWAGDDRFDGTTPRSPRTGPTPRQGTGPTPSQGTGPTPRQGTGPTPRQGTGPAPRQGTGPAPRQGNVSRQGGSTGARPPRPPRPQGADRDPWGDPRLPGDRSQPPTGPRPRANGQGRPAPQPRDRNPRPSWNPNPNPKRPPRPGPADGWPQR